MKRNGKPNSAKKVDGAGAFAVCSFFLLLGAAAGCFSGSFADIELLELMEGGDKFAQCLVLALFMTGAALLFGSSCIGFLLMPALSAAAGFAAGYVMAAEILVSGSWGEAFLNRGWFIAAALPAFLVLCTCALRTSAAALGIVVFGTRPEPGIISGFIKMIAICVLLSILLAAAAAL